MPPCGIMAVPRKDAGAMESPTGDELEALEALGVAADALGTERAQLEALGVLVRITAAQVPGIYLRALGACADLGTEPAQLEALAIAVQVVRDQVVSVAAWRRELEAEAAALELAPTR